MKKIILPMAVLLLVFAGYVLWKNMNVGQKPASQTPLTQTQTQTPPANQRVIDVSGANFSFSVSEIRVKKGENVAIRFTNSEGQHNLIIEGLNVGTSVLSTGQSETITIPTGAAGSYIYYCSVGQHRALGMVGKLIVE